MYDCSRGGNVTAFFWVMATITAIKNQKRNADRLNVYLDGEFAFGLAAVVAASLRIGQILSADEIAALEQQDDIEKARKSAIGLIGRRPRSMAEIERSLQKKEFDDRIIEQVIDRLAAVDLLNDAAFASYWVEQRETFRPRSKLALRQELQQKGVSRTVIDTVLNKVDEELAAWRVGQKQAARWAYLSEKEFRVKLGRFLQRRGFPYDVIKSTINDIWRALNDEEQFNYGQLDNEGVG